MYPQPNMKSHADLLSLYRVIPASGGFRIHY